MPNQSFAEYVDTETFSEPLQNYADAPLASRTIDDITLSFLLAYVIPVSGLLDLKLEAPLQRQ